MSAAQGEAEASFLDQAGSGDEPEVPGSDPALAKHTQSVAEIKVAAGALSKDDKDGAKRLIKMAIAAKADAIDKSQILKALAKSLGVPKADVEKEWPHAEGALKTGDSMWKEGEERRDAERLAREAKHAEFFERCKHIAKNPNLLKEMVDLVGRMGVIGERRGILGTCIVAASRFHIKGAISLLRRGAAASGKIIWQMPSSD